MVVHARRVTGSVGVVTAQPERKTDRATTVDRHVLDLVGQSPIGRIPVLDVQPSVDGGRRPTCSVVGEVVPVRATVFREGHDAVNATLVLTDPDGAEHHHPMTLLNPGLDLWGTTMSGDREGIWSYRVEGWSDPYGTWKHDATIKVRAGVDVEPRLEEGARVLERAVNEVRRPVEDARVLADAVTALRDTDRPAEARLQAGIAPEVVEVLTRNPL